MLASKSQNSWLPLLSVLGFGIIFRVFFRLNYLPDTNFFDEIINQRFADYLLPLQQWWKVGFTRWEYCFQTLFFQALGFSPLTAGIINSAVMGISTIWVLYVIGQRTAGRMTGWLAACFMGMALYPIFISTIALEFSSATFWFFIASSLFLFQERIIPNRSLRVALFAVAALNSLLSYGACIAGLAALLMERGYRRVRGQKLTESEMQMSAIATVLIAIACLLQAKFGSLGLSTFFRVGSLPIGSARGYFKNVLFLLNEIFIHGRTTYSNFGGYSLIEPVISILALKGLFRKNSLSQRLVALFFILMFLLCLLEEVSGRRMCIVAPLIYLAAAIELTAILKNRSQIFTSAVIALLFCSILTRSANGLYRFGGHSNTPVLDEEIASVLQVLPLVVVDQERWLAYYIWTFHELELSKLDLHPVCYAAHMEACKDFKKVAVLSITPLARLEHFGSAAYEKFETLPVLAHMHDRLYLQLFRKTKD